MGWSIMKVYRDEGVSGAKSRAERPAFNALWKDATCRRFDMVMAWSVDRLGRSLQDLVPFLSELHALRIDLYLHQQGVDTSTPAGKALFQMTGVFAEFERAMIRERVKSGLERAKAQGKILGRPPIAPRKEAAILDDLREGKAGICKQTQAAWSSSSEVNSQSGPRSSERRTFPSCGDVSRSSFPVVGPLAA